MGLAAVGFLVSLTPRGLPESQRPFVRWLGCYTILLTALYAVIPYKTPWCLLSFLHGMILLAGVGGWVLLRAPRSMVGRGLMAVALVVGLVHLGWQSYALNFRFFADQRNPYVYAHTSPDAVNLASRMEELAALAPDGHEMVIHIVTPENPWPLPWYLRRFNPDHVGHWSDTAKWRSETETQPPPSVIILTEAVRDAVEAAFPDGYNRQMNFGLRPGVLLSVYVRQELWDAFLATVRPAD
jgi:predicted membrane-bound mannosyltransferase